MKKKRIIKRHNKTCCNINSQQLNSAIWIIQKYGSSITQVENSICSSGYFTCSTGTPRHITNINLVGYSTTTTTTPTGVSQFDFPELVNLKITASISFTKPNTNILEFITASMTSLRVIDIKSDSTANMLPPNFGPSLPLLTFFSVQGAKFQHDVIFNFGPAIESVQFEVFGYVAIDETTPIHPNLKKLNIGVYLATDRTISFTAQSFPALEDITLLSVISSKALTTYCNVSNPKSFTLSSPQSATDSVVYILNPQSITLLRLQGAPIKLYPSIDSFTNIVTLTYQFATFTNFPFTGQYPNSLETFSSTVGQLTAFPNIPINNVKTIQLAGNKLQGDIPWSALQDANNIYFDVSSNTDLVTAIPQSFCNNRLNLYQCPGITVVPECFLCYQKNTENVYTDIVLDPGFTCNITFQSTNIYTIFGYGYINGQNIGYGSMSVDFQYNLRPVIPNRIIEVEDLSPAGPPRPILIRLDSFYPEYEFTFTTVEVGIMMEGDVTYKQLASQTIQFQVFANALNSFITHTIKVNNAIDCITSPVGQITTNTIVYCNITGHSFKQGDTWNFAVSNSQYQLDKTVNMTSYYPSNMVLANWDSIIKVGSAYDFTGSFGSATMDQVAVYFNGDSSICNVRSFILGLMQCNQTKFWPGIGLTNITISVNGFSSTPIFANITSVQSLCIYSNGCSGHGTCDQNGTCICDTGYYSDKCSQKYPTFASGEYDLNDRKLISIYGDFGPFNQTIVSITLNNTDCQVTYKSQSLINCTLVSEPTDGLALVRLTVDNSTNNGNNWIYFKPSSQGSGSGSDSNELTCPFNCYGHGQCINGKCKCDTGYSSIDNCLTKTSNHTNTPNTTSPTTSFDIDGIDFQFEMIAIQEIDTDDNIINQVLTNSWNSTLSLDNQTQTTTVNYQLNNSDTTTTTATILTDNQTQTTTVNYQLNNSDTTALVTATISFSQQPRDIQFGSQLLHIDANSIKLSVNISNWTFNTFLTTLRVIFKTTINNDQSIEFDCQDVNIDTLSYDQLSNSIQYLRVVKDNIQFTGRFIDYVLSDGRPTFSKTSIINKTDESGDQSQSTILIGISMPQCQSCSLDPDFTPLLIDKSNDNGCDSKSDTWRIIVCVVVGVVGAVAIGVASIILIKKKQTTKRYNDKMQHKLAKMN
ncbi:hypothetical protein DFA_09552 [Cavenderia fasciculata]|uniref:EGF-like domain-containing protein n=1 Tax=Cavenderia fasciculata TaxID=261658 RepID=F4Q7Y3_CACFS|nr:uncharacterized protein DFA_09552 [Cavenderia fasciculata]EGG15883.1 hypothetical protein DFA_09552 [Cavenderia fasciculata]|eukprot:XP_004352208.1 hypothetical protein DFA_09552 [Cavenderia fasciculata]